MNTNHVHTLWLTGVLLVISGLLVNQTSGNVVYQILVVNGVLASMAYLAFRGFLTENPKFLAAREKLMFCLWIMVAGTIGVSISTILELLSIGIFVSSPLLWGGGIAFVVSAWAFIISFVIARPKPLGP